MELRHLKYFTVVAQEESVTRAAALLHVSQPALSRQIRDLELELGVELFEHSARSVKLTEAGRVFLGEARAALQRVETAVQTLKAFAGVQEGELHVGYAPSLTTVILPRTLRVFQEACPRVRVRLHDLTTDEMLAGLREGTLQTALLVKPAAKALGRMEYAEVVRHRPCVAMAPAHSPAGSGPASIHSLAGQMLVAYSRDQYPEYHAWLETLLKKVRPPPRIVAEYDSSTSLIAAVESGCGVALVQEGFESLSGDRLNIRPLKEVLPCFSFGISWRKDDLTASTRRFVDAVLQCKSNGSTPSSSFPREESLQGAMT